MAAGNIITNQVLIQAFLNHVELKYQEFRNSPDYDLYSKESHKTTKTFLGFGYMKNSKKADEILDRFCEKVMKERKEEYGIIGNVKETTKNNGPFVNGEYYKSNLEVIDEDKALLFILKYS